ncbi:MAG: DNA-directed DNA polymerase II small subunit, partial [Candidatus Micrarchaeota archaeon]
ADDFKSIINEFEKKDVRFTPEALKLLKEAENPRAAIEGILAENPLIFIISEKEIDKELNKKLEEKIPLPVEVLRAPDFKPIAKDFSAELEFYKAGEITGQSKCTGTVDDFVGYFRNRFESISSMLRARQSPNGITPLLALKNYASGKEVRIIGMVVSKKVTRNKHLLVELEDEESNARVLFLRSDHEPQRSVFEKAGRLLFDEVVAIDAKISSNQFIIAKDIIWPDIPIRTPRALETDVAVGFLSDLHVGSRYFMETQFNSMLKWLNGSSESASTRELAGKIKYLVIAGDVVDGIGIYPKQEKELTVRDIYEQYKIFSQLLCEIPDYINIIVSPGNHDAVRRAEPQPKLPDELVGALKDRGNVYFIGSPCLFSLEDYKVLAYHGTSLDSIISALPGLSYQHPDKPMLELLKRRNLSPIYGENPIVPESRDYMAITEVPDFLHMGHVHKNAYADYHGTAVINSGTWQAQTDFQVRQGHVPSPCIMPVYELRYNKINFVNFNAPVGE